VTDERTASPGSELRRVRGLIADLDAVVWEADARSMRFTFVSDGVTELLGYTRSEWLAEPEFWAEHIHPDDRELAMETFIHAATEGGRFDMEYRFMAKDGTAVWLRDIGHVVTDVEARPVLLRGLMVEITAQKAAEEDRRESQERFQRVVEHMSGIVYIEGWAEPGSGVPGPMIYVSPQIKEILGFEPQEWLGDRTSWVRALHPEDRERMRTEVSAAVASGGTIDVTYRAFAKDGRQVWFRDQATLVRDPEGRPLFWQGVMFDVTAERENAERARASESRYRTLIEHLPAIVYTEPHRREGIDILYVSPRVEPMLGISAREWAAEPGTWFANIHPDDRDAVEAANRLADETGAPFVMDYRMLARDGKVIWFHDEAVLVNDAGAAPFWQGVMMDITARKEAEAQVAQAEARYRNLVEQNPAITYLDALAGPGSTVYISPQTTKILGYTPQDWYDDPELWSKIVHPDDSDVGSRSGSNGEPHSSEYRLIAKDGRTVWVHDRASLITDGRGEPMYWQGLLVDITERKLSEDLAVELVVEREAAERLRFVDDMKNTFLQAVSHDLRTPLAAILGLAVTVEREDLDLPPDEIREMGKRIAQNARKLDRLVNDLLDLDRLSRGIIEPALRDTDVGALVSEIVVGSDILSGRRVTVDIQKVRLPVDVAKVDRIVENLLSNTLRHTPEGASVWIKVEKAKGGAIISVEDDGPGVAEDQRERIFEPFSTASASVGEPPSAGIGLSLVSRFAELHGGRAWVEEREGGGAAFRVFLSRTPPKPPTVTDGGEN
jgi:PAS domain S-box-containing protein